MHRFARAALAALACLQVSSVLARAPELQRGDVATRLYSLSAREAQFHALSSLPETSVDYDGKGRFKTIVGNTGIFLPRDAHLRKEEVGAWVFQKLKPMLLASGKEDLRISRVTTDLTGQRYVFLDQLIDGIPVIDAGVNLRSSIAGEVLQATSRFVPARDAVKTPKVSLQEARAIVQRAFGDARLADPSSVRTSPKGSLGFWTDEGAAPTPVLVWLINANVTLNGENLDLRFAVDAVSGEIRQSQKTRFGLNRKVYSLNYGTTFDVPHWPENLQLLWTEGYPNPSDAQGMFVYENVAFAIRAWQLGGLYSFGYDWPYIVVHYGSPNSSWYAGGWDEPFLVFGDNYAVSRDAVAHEYGHGIYVPWTVSVMPSRYLWYDEWFAVNEFFGDLSAVMTDFDRFGSTDWWIHNVRNLANPVASGSPDDLRDWYPNRRFFGTNETTSYSNSTIFSHALYLMIHGGEHARAGITVDAFSGAIPQIYVNPIPARTVQFVFADALNTMSANFTKVNGPNLKAATVASAQRLYGATVAEEVDKAWRAVGIGNDCSGPPQPVANISYIDFQCKGRYRVSWTQVPGLKYHAEVKPIAIGSSWDFGTTTTDGAMSSCMQSVPMASYFHMRACNACGCSDWSQEKRFSYYEICK